VSRRRGDHAGASAGPDGVLVVDKPGGVTSHGVVARVRGSVGSRRVGHAGTLDPMATGVLVLGVGRGTRLLQFMTGLDKSYLATVRLGVTTVSDDADGEVVAHVSTAGLDLGAVEHALAGQHGAIEQVPSAVSAVKVDGRRAYARVRAGEDVALAPRAVTVHRLDILAWRPGPQVADLDIAVACSSGTYVRAIARDVGVALGVGGHLVALRRTAVGPFTLEDAVLDVAMSSAEAPPAPELLTLGDASGRLLPTRTLTTSEAEDLAHGRPVGPSRRAGCPAGPVAALDATGRLVAVVTDRGPQARPLAVFVG